MNRTVELLEIAQEWEKLAKAAIIPAVQKACSNQRLIAINDLLEHRTQLYESRLKCMFNPPSNGE